MRKFQDYYPAFAANLVPVIPYGATLSPQSTVKPKDIGKVPGMQGYDGNWSSFNWRAQSMALAADMSRWQKMGAGIGFRGGHDGIVGLDFDITDRSDADAALELLTESMGILPIRRVKHRDHVKFLALARIVDQYGEPVVVPSTDLNFKQSDGDGGKLQLLSMGRYFNVHGVHPARLTPYVWDTDPADSPVPEILYARYKATLQVLRDTFRADQSFSDEFNDRMVGEIGDEEEVRALLAVVPNDESFVEYDRFQAMGRVLWGASAGASWGWELWLEWCGQQGQEQPDKPQDMWDSFRGSRNGVERLRVWANRRDPYGRAVTLFDENPLPQEVIDALESTAEEAVVFVTDNYYVAQDDRVYIEGGIKPITTTAFNHRYSEARGRLKQQLAKGRGKPTPLTLFLLNSENVVSTSMYWPGKSRIFTYQGYDRFNLWTPPARTHKGQVPDQKILTLWRDLMAVVFGPESATIIKWLAFLLQHPGLKPGWHPIIQSRQGIGKDAAMRPILNFLGPTLCQSLDPQDLGHRFNTFVKARLALVPEMKLMKDAHEAYNRLKTFTEQSEWVPIERKGLDKTMVRNGVCFMIFSNEAKPLYIGQGDRRFYVIDRFNAEQWSAERYAEIFAMFDSAADADCSWMVAEYLLTYPLTVADTLLVCGQAPASEAKDAIIDSSRTEFEEYFLEYLEEVAAGRGSPIATAQEIERSLAQRGIKSPRVQWPTLYRNGCRPLQPDKANPQKAAVFDGKGKYWRLVRYYLQNNRSLDLEAIHETPGGRTQLYKTFALGEAAEFKPFIVRNDADAPDEEKG